MPDFHDPEILRAVLDSSQNDVSAADRNGKILFWNQGAERLTGHKRHPVVRRCIVAAAAGSPRSQESSET
jgi:PAS domain S-box-containing protein